MPISEQGDYSNGYFDRVYIHIFKLVIEDVGYEAYRVDGKNYDSIIVKIFKALQGCPMALCDMSNTSYNIATRKVYLWHLKHKRKRNSCILRHKKCIKIIN